MNGTVRPDECIVCGWFCCVEYGCCGPHDEPDHPPLYGFNMDPDTDLDRAAAEAKVAMSEGRLKEWAIANGWADEWSWA